MMCALTVAASSSWWSGLESQRCLSGGSELRARSVGQNIVNGRWMDDCSTGSRPARCTHKQNKINTSMPTNPSTVALIGGWVEGERGGTEVEREDLIDGWMMDGWKTE